MPIRKVKGGYKWGDRGKAFKTRAGAAAQARAAYANGYRGDGRAVIHRKAQAIRASKRAETRYVRDLRGILAQIHSGYLRALQPHLARATGLRHDISAHDLDLHPIEVKLSRYIRETVPPAFDRMAGEVNKANAKGSRVLGISVSAARVAADIARFREQNIALVENAARDYADDVRDVMGDPDNYGLRVEDLADKLQERGNVSESRAELIARDQTLKLNGQLTMTRQKAAGVDRYTWNTSHDERVRDSHAELDGQVFGWDSPPEPGHPGEDFQCRCVAIPVLDELEGI